MSEGTSEETTSVEVVESAPEVQEQATAPDTSTNDDALFEAMEKEQFGAVEQSEYSEPQETEVIETVKHLEPSEIAPDLHEKPVEAAEEVTEIPRNLIDPDTEYVFKDADGTEYTVKGSDAIYQTSKYHDKMRQIHEEAQQYKPLEEMFQYEKGKLAAKVLETADVAERLNAVATILRETGAPDLADAIDERMQANNLQYNPLEAQQSLLEKQKSEVESQRARFMAQQALATDTQALESRLGRTLTARESGGINTVFANWISARQANPSLARPSFESAYKMAQDAIRFEDSNRAPAQKPKSTVERIKTRAVPETKAQSDDELFFAAMQEQHIGV
jgi:hypothetical protein